MTMRSFIIVLLSIGLFGCMTTSVQRFSMLDGVDMYFLPPTKWNGNGVYAEIDFNYKTKQETDTICNITINGKKEMPNGISTVIFSGNNNSYKLTGLSVIWAESKNKKLRITTNFNRDDFLQFIRSDKLYLEIQMNNKTYKLLPSKAFLRLRTDFINDLDGKEKAIIE